MTPNASTAQGRQSCDHTRLNRNDIRSDLDRLLAHRPMALPRTGRPGRTCGGCGLRPPVTTTVSDDMVVPNLSGSVPADVR